MLLINLFERRIETAMEVLGRYADRPNLYVTFVDIEKLGLNPSSEHTSTPAGIYAYPLAEAYAEMQTKTIPFAADRKYIYLFEGQGEILDLQTYDESQLEADVDRLMTHHWQMIDPSNEEFAISMLTGWFEDMPHEPGRAIWALTSRIANRAARLTNRESNFVWNSLLRKMGYAGVVDHGDRIIHAHEPFQALFLTKGACRPITILVNDHLKVATDMDSLNRWKQRPNT